MFSSCLPIHPLAHLSMYIICPSHQRGTPFSNFVIIVEHCTGNLSQHPTLREASARTNFDSLHPRVGAAIRSACSMANLLKAASYN